MSLPRKGLMVEASGTAPESRNVFTIEDIRVFRTNQYRVIRLVCQPLKSLKATPSLRSSGCARTGYGIPVGGKQ